MKIKYWVMAGTSVGPNFPTPHHHPHPQRGRSPLLGGRQSCKHCLLCNFYDFIKNVENIEMYPIMVKTQILGEGR